MRAHSDIKNILIFEKHEGFLRRPSPSSMCPPLRSESRCFFTCILASLYPHGNARNRKHTGEERPRGKTPAGTGFRFSHLKTTFAVLLVANSSSYTPSSYETHVQTPRGFCRQSVSKHCLVVDAQEHVNSLKVFAKAKVK